MPGVNVTLDGDGAAAVSRKGFEVQLRGVCRACDLPKARRRSS